MDEQNYMSIKEFREKGYLQEANRLFFHPLGLALSVEVDEDGNEVLSGIWDGRDDPEGIIFDPDDVTRESYGKAMELEDERFEREMKRKRRFGWFIQPMRPGGGLPKETK